jgi:hypothetical protein
MRSFKSANAYHQFARRVLSVSRYLIDAESREFLGVVLEQAAQPDRQQVIPAGAFFWRAQLGSEVTDDDQAIAHPPVRMKPCKGRAKEGRANPKGMPYLYLASEKDTAMAEVRPGMGSDISLARFKLLREVRIAHCWVDDTERPRRPLFQAIPREEWDKAVWDSIDRAFSRPVTPTDDLAHYAPTQIVAELFKTNGYDGIAYRSSVRKGGHNVVLFDPDAADPKTAAVYLLKDVSFTFEQSSNEYYVPDS